MKFNFKETIMKKFITTVMLFVAMTLSVSAQADDCYSSGVRTGTIQKFSQKGILAKSWEGELVQEGIRTKSNPNGGNGLTNVWKFSVTNAAVAAKIEAAIFDGKNVAVKYCQSMIRNPLTQDTSYAVTDAKALN